MGSTMTGIDAIELLAAQHRATARLFAALAGGNGGDRRWSRLLALEDALVAHSEIEQRYLYPAVRAAQIDALVDDLQDDHRSVRRMLGALLALGPAKPEFVWLLEELRGVVEDHVIIEERDLFPRLRDQVPREVLLELGSRMLASLEERHRDSLPLAEAGTS
jgi:hypothetical protein